MYNSNNFKEKEVGEIELKIEEILREKLYMGAEQISQLSVIDLFYLYGEITVEFGVFLTIQDIDADCFSSIHRLACAIQKEYNKEIRNEKTC